MNDPIYDSDGLRISNTTVSTSYSNSVYKVSDIRSASYEEGLVWDEPKEYSGIYANCAWITGIALGLLLNWIVGIIAFGVIAILAWNADKEYHAKDKSALDQQQFVCTIFLEMTEGRVVLKRDGFYTRNPNAPNPKVYFINDFIENYESEKAKYQQKFQIILAAVRTAIENQPK